MIKVRYYIVHGYSYPSEIVPQSVLTNLPPVPVSKVITAGDTVLIAVIRDEIRLREHRLEWCYYLAPSNILKVFRTATEKIIATLPAYQRIKAPITDPALLAQGKCQLPYYSVDCKPLVAYGIEPTQQYIMSALCLAPPSVIARVINDLDRLDDVQKDAYEQGINHNDMALISTWKDGKPARTKETINDK